MYACRRHSTISCNWNVGRRRDLTPAQKAIIKPAVALACHEAVAFNPIRQPPGREQKNAPPPDRNVGQTRASKRKPHRLEKKALTPPPPPIENRHSLSTPAGFGLKRVTPSVKTTKGRTDGFSPRNSYTPPAW